VPPSPPLPYATRTIPPSFVVFVAVQSKSPFFREVTLRHWVTGSRRFDTTYQADLEKSQRRGCTCRKNSLWTKCISCSVTVKCGDQRGWPSRVKIVLVPARPVAAVCLCVSRQLNQQRSVSTAVGCYVPITQTTLGYRQVNWALLMCGVLCDVCVRVAGQMFRLRWEFWAVEIPAGEQRLLLVCANQS
jgi:hypothetical protein